MLTAVVASGTFPTESREVMGSARQRIRIEIVEAEVESIFGLLDDAAAALDDGETENARRAVAYAEDVQRDIERRLRLLGEIESGPFQELLAEVRREISEAQSRCR